MYKLHMCKWMTICRVCSQVTGTIHFYLKSDMVFLIQSIRICLNEIFYHHKISFQFYVHALSYNYYHFLGGCYLQEEEEKDCGHESYRSDREVSEPTAQSIV